MTIKYRSKFEKTLGKLFEVAGVVVNYEPFKLPYVLHSTYTPDFELPNGIIIEAKGVLKPSDRRKMKAVKKQHPDLDIRFVFQNAYNKLDKRSPTSYAQWAEKNGFLWAHKKVPEEWMH